MACFRCRCKSDESDRSPFASNPIIAQRVRARLEVFSRALTADRLREVSQLTSLQPWLIPEFRHEFPAMPFDPSDFIFGKFTLPPRRWFWADLRKVNSGRGVTTPELTNFRRRQ